MILKPLRDQIFAVRAGRENLTKAGIVIPDNAQEVPIRATVTAVGPGRVFENGTVVPMTVKVGDKVVFDPRSVAEIRLSSVDNPILCMTERDVICVVEEGLGLV